MAKSTTIFERLEDNQEEIKKKLNVLEEKAERKAERKVRRERIIEMARNMDFFEKAKLIIKLL